MWGVLQFINTLEENIFAKINAVVNVTIDKVTMGSVLVANTVAFTGANAAGAIAGQDALSKVMTSGDVSSIFGDSFGTVTVTEVKSIDATNPSELRLYILYTLEEALDTYPNCNAVSGCVLYALLVFRVAKQGTVSPCRRVGLLMYINHACNCIMQTLRVQLML